MAPHIFNHPRYIRFLHRKGPKSGYSEAWMDDIHVYWWCIRLVGHYPYTHVTCRTGGSTSMACGSSHNNILNPEDGLVVLQFSPNLVQQLGCTEAWMNRILEYWLCPRLVRLWLCTHNTCGVGGTTSMACSAWYNDIHNDIVVLQFLPNMVQQLGYSVAYMDEQYSTIQLQPPQIYHILHSQAHSQG